MVRIATATVKWFSSWLVRLLVDFRWYRCGLRETCPHRIRCILSMHALGGLSCGTSFFQHVVHYKVLDLVLYGWIEQVSLFQGHLTFKDLLAPVSGGTGNESVHVPAGFLKSLLARVHLKMKSSVMCHLSSYRAQFPEVLPCWNLLTCFCFLDWLQGAFFCEESSSCFLWSSVGVSGMSVCMSQGVFVHGSTSLSGMSVEMSRYCPFCSFCSFPRAAHGIGREACGS